MKFKWFVGIDVSKKTLDVTLFFKGNADDSVHKQMSNDEKGYRAIINWLRKQSVETNEVLFCMEHTGVYSYELAVYFEQMHIVYCMVSPLHIKRSMGLVRGKNDKVDSYQISRFCYLHKDELTPTKLPQASLKLMKGLINERERLVKMRKSEKVILSELKKVNSDTSLKRTELRIKMFSDDIDSIENEIEQVIKADVNLLRNYKLIKSVVGIGLVNSVLFMLYTQNFIAFTDARKYTCYGGVAPFENRSGTSYRGKSRVSHLANKRIKANLSNAARTAVQNDPELRLYYNRKAEEGKEHGIIMNAIKFKLITRVFAVVERGTPYVIMRQAG